jgi:hypothetical protein
MPWNWRWKNSMDIVVQRYNTWFGDTDILQTEGGGLPFGVSGAAIRQSTANIPFLNYDPTITQSVFFDNRITAVKQPVGFRYRSVAGASGKLRIAHRAVQHGLRPGLFDGNHVERGLEQHAGIVEFDVQFLQPGRGFLAEYLDFAATAERIRALRQSPAIS